MEPINLSQIQTPAGMFVDDGFENFFNNESLSDRILLISETEKVECYSGGTESQRGTKRKGEGGTFEYMESCVFKRPFTIKQEDIEDKEGEDTIPDENHAHLEIFETSLRNQCRVASAREEGTSLIQHIKVEDDFDDQTNHQVNELEVIIPPQIGDTNISPVSENVDTSAVSTDIEHANAAVNNPPSSPEMPVDDENVVETNLVEVDNQAENAKVQEESSSKEILVTSGEDEREDERPINSIIGIDSSVNSQCSEVDSPIVKRTYVLETKILKESKVYVHSIILAAKSDFFKCLFSTSGMKETQQQEVKIEVGRGETENMLIMLRCFYNRNFINQHSLDVVIKVCSMAMKYCFDGLIDKCLEVFANRADNINEIEDFNRINVMVNKIQNDLHQHRSKGDDVLTKCNSFLISTFKKLDECFEKTPCKLFQLRLESMNLFLSPNVQANISNHHGNLFLYAMQRWIRNHHLKYNLQYESDQNQVKRDTFIFIEQLLKSVSLKNVTSDFLTNVMNFQISPFNIWPGYKDWYIRALQNHIFENSSHGSGIKAYPTLSRQREMRYARQEKNADIFSMAPVILNGFEIGIYLRIREDRKVHMLCKCKNFLLNKVGFDKATLTFSIKGLLKLNTNSTLWKEPFPRQFGNHPAPASMYTDRFTFSYKQNTMCLQMYSLCKLSPAVYNIAKRSGFLIEFDIQHVH